MQTLDAQQTSLIGTTSAKPVEIKIPLWWADGTSTNVTGSAITSTNKGYLIDGSTSVSQSPVPSNSDLHTLNSKWSASTNFAFEVTLMTTNAGSTAYAEVWDLTSNTEITASQVNTTSTTATVLRSGTFTLTAGHVIGVAIWASNSNYGAKIVDASLIVFPN